MSASAYRSHSVWVPGLLLLLWIGAAPAFVQADVPPPPKSESGDAEDNQEQKQIATIALYLLIAVTTGGVSLLIVLLLWGARIRRQVRKPLPDATPQDPLWYLKGKKPTLGEPNPPANVSDQKDGSKKPPAGDSHS